MSQGWTQILSVTFTNALERKRYAIDNPNKGDLAQLLLVSLIDGLHRAGRLPLGFVWGIIMRFAFSRGSRQIILAAVTAICALVARDAGATPTTSIVVNDKTFADISYSDAVTGGAVQPTTIDIAGVPVATPLTLPGPGLAVGCAGCWAAGPGQTSTITFSFTVTAGSGYLIDDVSASLLGATASGTGTISLVETLTNASGADGSFDACFPATAGCSSSFLDTLLPTTTDFLSVQDVITVTGGTGVADLGEFRLAFSEVPVPEPTSLAIFGTGLAALGLVRRRKRKAA